MAKHKSLFKDKALIITLAIIIILLSAYFTYSFIIKVPICSDKECFIKSLRGCSKATFFNQETSASWLYEVKNSDNGNCIVNVKAIQVGADLATSNFLKDKEMECNIPKSLAGSFMPESKIEYCHGLLKESIQDIMIRKMQLYIIQNMGQINLASTLNA